MILYEEDLIRVVDSMESYLKILRYAISEKNNDVDNINHILSKRYNIDVRNLIAVKCKCCGKIFFTNNRKVTYCDRVDKTGKRCSAVGSQRSFQKKMETEEELKIYTRAYKTHFARVKKGTMGQDAFAKWCTEAKAKLEQVRAGKLDITVFQEWLKK